MCSHTLGDIPRCTQDHSRAKNRAASLTMNSQIPLIKFFFWISVCMPISPSMKQSLHQAVAVASREARPPNMTGVVPGTLWNQPAIPRKVSRQPWPTRKGHGLSGTTWKGWTSFRSWWWASAADPI